MNKKLKYFKTYSLIICLGLIILIYFGRLDVVVEGKGIIITDIDIANVQHLEGGIVESSNVKIGDYVEAGQTLVVLNTAGIQADVNELEGLLYGYQIDCIRLRTELTGSNELVFTEKQKLEFSDLVQDAIERLKSRKNKIEQLVAVQLSILDQRKMEVEETIISVDSNMKILKILQEQLKISDDLLKEKISTRYNHLELLREEVYIRGLIEEDEKRILRLNLAVKEARERIKTIRRNYRDEIRVELADAVAAEKRASERLAKSLESLDRMNIKAPITGKVQNVNYPTKGGVIPPGATLVEIIPTNAKLLVKAHVGTNDRGYLQKGSEVAVGLISDISREFPNLVGKVIDIKQNTTKQEYGQPVYEVYIELTNNKFENNKKSYPLFPGIEVVSYINLGERRIFEYLLSPFFSLGKFPLSEI